MIFWNFRQYDAKPYVLSFPEEGDARTDARTHGGIIHSELSPLERGMRISQNKAKQEARVPRLMKKSC